MRTAMTEITAFIDDSGDPGIGNKTSPYLVFGAVLTEDAEELRNSVCYAASVLRINGEVKAENLRPSDCKEILSRIQPQTTGFFSVIFNKKYAREFYRTGKTNQNLYNDTLQTIIDFVMNSFGSQIEFVCDERTKPKAGKRRTEYVIPLTNENVEVDTAPDGSQTVKVKMINGKWMNFQIHYSKSYSDYGLQSADVFAGTVFRAIRDNNSEMLTWIKKAL